MYWKNKKSIILYLLPLTLLIVFIITFGIYKTWVISIKVGSNENIFSNYLKLLSDSEFLKSFIFSFKNALVSSLLSVVIGLLVALFLWSNKGKRMAKLLTYLPIITPHLVIAMLFIIIFSQTGLISRLCYYLGLIKQPDQFMQLINDENGIGIILAYVYKGFPFIAIMILLILNSINYKEIRLAKLLGANKSELFKKIIFPKVIVTMLIAFIILFIYSFSAYEIPSLLGVSAPKALPVLVYQHYSDITPGLKEYAMSINIFIIIFCLVFTLLIFIIIKIMQRKYHE